MCIIYVLLYHMHYINNTHLIEVLVVAVAHQHVIEAAIGRVYAELGRVHRVRRIGILNGNYYFF